MFPRGMAGARGGGRGEQGAEGDPELHLERVQGEAGREPEVVKQDGQRALNVSPRGWNFILSTK